MASEAMNVLADRYASRGVASVFVYTREAHPGENFPHHTSFEQKLRHAAAMREVGGVTRPILVDDLEGSCHRSWALLPNMCFIVARGGRIAYKADWTAPDDVADALEHLLDRDPRRVPFYSERLAFRTRDNEAFMDHLRRVGPKAVEDFTR